MRLSPKTVIRGSALTLANHWTPMATVQFLLIPQVFSIINHKLLSFLFFPKLSLTLSISLSPESNVQTLSRTV